MQCQSNVRVIPVPMQGAIHFQGLIEELLRLLEISSWLTSPSAWSVTATPGWSLSPCKERFIRKDSSKCSFACLRSPACWLTWPSAWSVTATPGWFLFPCKERFIRKESSKCCFACLRSPACWLTSPSACSITAIPVRMQGALHFQGLMEELLRLLEISSLLAHFC